LQYTYSATQNNGQITQAVDTLSGETISYHYDALKRLTLLSAAVPTLVLHCGKLFRTVKGLLAW
jgi:hypothetical protein